jgi:two-component system sensor histidine kinase CiaH
MIASVKKKFAFITVVYWVLLLYMIAALVWWFVALNKQNADMAAFRLADINKDDPAYISKVEKINEAQKRKTAQYIGEGSTFLALILIGAVFIYRATRKQIKLSTQQQNFMMAVTHELKTPIAITQLNLETLQKRKLEEDKQQKLISNTLQEANRLNSLCNNILLAAQLDGGAYNSSKQEINLSDLIEGCIESYSNRFPNGKITASIDERLYMTGEHLLIQMLVNNLIDNAIKYAPKTSPIHISLQEQNKKALLKVADEGFGISNEEKKKVFDKFYRTGNENTRSAKGTGLGLYLCKKIVEDHKGYITVTDNLPQGSIFTVTFTLQHER